MKRNLNRFLESNFYIFEPTRNAAATENKQIAHGRYLLSFTSWLLFVIFLTGELTV